MECVEEELEPWQKRAPDVYTIDDDDDEPIFVGVICTSYLNELFTSLCTEFALCLWVMICVKPGAINSSCHGDVCDQHG